MSDKLPIETVLEELLQALATHDEAILQAPPGAGKTTLVPLKFLEQVNGKIILLEPRRIAARNAAHRMAHLLDEKVGETVGYRMRLDTRVTPKTRIEVVTEGVLINMLQQDPSLDGVDLVIFDEFHERSLDADLALSMILKARELFRDKPLKLLVMSATLEQQGLAQLLNSPPQILSEGKSFPVEIHYGSATKPQDRTVPKALASVREVLSKHPHSSVLVFLPGEGEIRQLETQLRELNLDKVDIAPLFGSLSLEAQARAVEPSASNRRKVVLATNVAETSLTIDGVDVVIDSGLERRARFDPNTATTRLHTQRISQSSSTQRTGRAGRIAPGHCYRLWSKDQQQQLAQNRTPEIVEADLGNLVLQLLRWGLWSFEELDWLNPPPGSNWQQAVGQLSGFGAVIQSETSLRLTPHGELMAGFATEPRLSHLLIRSAEQQAASIGSALAALWSDRDPFSRDEEIGASVEKRVAIILGELTCPGRYRGWLHRTRQLQQQFQKQLSVYEFGDSGTGLGRTDQIATLVALAFPDRIARRRHAGTFQLANGRSAKLDDNARSSLGNQKWLAVSEITGSTKGTDIIRSAVELDAKLFDDELNMLVSEQRVVDWDKKQSRFIAEQQTRIGQLVLARTTISDLGDRERVPTICAYIAGQGLQIFKQHQKLKLLQNRCRLLGSELDFDLSDEALIGTLEDWLGPYLSGLTKLDDINKLDIEKICRDRFSYEQQQLLDRLAPMRIEVPSGSNISIDYSQQPPVLAVKLQEMFGCDETPTVANGKVALKVYLLSPAGRPLHITQDLHSFWRSGYQSVRKDMRGRYPKHPWPEDPTEALPTRKTNRSK
jgi:ATP-dependent helicase HrpB